MPQRIASGAAAGTADYSPAQASGSLSTDLSSHSGNVLLASSSDTSLFACRFFAIHGMWNMSFFRVLESSQIGT